MTTTGFKLPTPCQKINMLGVDVVVKRDDLNHPVLQGNKLRKLKFNIQAAKNSGAKHLLTFGGAYSNHLLATAYAAKESGLKSVGVVRGHELADNQAVWSETLYQCQKLGMQLTFVTRTDYHMKTESEVFKQLMNEFDRPYVIPEGGSNELALDGVAELVSELNQQLNEPPTQLICPVGTGGTFAGLVMGVAQYGWQCQVVGVGVLKGLQSVKNNINQWLVNVEKPPKHVVLGDYHAGGYAKNSKELIRFSVTFEQQQNIKLDKIYNSKSFYALAQMIKTGQITATDRPVIIHTGGLQGGVNQ